MEVVLRIQFGWSQLPRFHCLGNKELWQLLHLSSQQSQKGEFLLVSAIWLSSFCNLLLFQCCDDDQMNVVWNSGMTFKSKQIFPFDLKFSFIICLSLFLEFRSEGFGLDKTHPSSIFCLGKVVPCWNMKYLWVVVCLINRELDCTTTSSL